MPVIALAPESEIAEKLISNLEEVKARGGTLYVFADPISKNGCEIRRASSTCQNVISS
jgi:glucosamine 6-phosphate synthetase-like amidotransferase/phosphosugar isomerase protein